MNLLTLRERTESPHLQLVVTVRRIQLDCLQSRRPTPTLREAPLKLAGHFSWLVPKRDRS